MVHIQLQRYTCVICPQRRRRLRLRLKRFYFCRLIFSCDFLFAFHSHSASSRIAETIKRSCGVSIEFELTKTTYDERAHAYKTIDQNIQSLRFSMVFFKWTTRRALAFSFQCSVDQIESIECSCEMKSDCRIPNETRRNCPRETTTLWRTIFVLKNRFENFLIYFVQTRPKRRRSDSNRKKEDRENIGGSRESWIFNCIAAAVCVESIHLVSVNILKWITPTRKMQVILILKIVRVRMKFNWDEEKRDQESDMFAKPIFLRLGLSLQYIRPTTEYVVQSIDAWVDCLSIGCRS